MLAAGQGHAFLSRKAARSASQEGFQGMLGETAADHKNAADRAEVERLEDTFNQKLSSYVRDHNTLMQDTQRFVSVTAPGANPYAGKLVKDGGGTVAYVSRYGIAHGLTRDAYLGMLNSCAEVSFPETIPVASSTGGWAILQPDVPLGNTGLVTGSTIDKPIPCGYEGQSIQVTERHDTAALWAASEGAAAWPLEQEPYGQAAARADYGTPFIGCLAPTGGQASVHADLSDSDRQGCFARATDVGHNVFGLNNASAGSDGLAKGQCVTYAQAPPDGQPAFHEVIASNLFVSDQATPSSMEMGVTRDGRFVVTKGRDSKMFSEYMEAGLHQPLGKAALDDEFKLDIAWSTPNPPLAGCGPAMGGNINFDRVQATVGPPYENCVQATDVDPAECLKLGMNGLCTSPVPFTSDGNLGTFMQRSCAASCQSPSLVAPPPPPTCPADMQACISQPNSVWCMVDNKCVDMSTQNAGLTGSACRGVAQRMTLQGNCIGLPQINGEPVCTGQTPDPAIGQACLAAARGGS